MKSTERSTRPSGIPPTFDPHARCPRWVRRALVLVQSELTAPLHLDQLAASVGRSKHFLVREFRRHYHCSPIRLQRALRLTEAARRLAAGSPPVIVAAELGFADQAHLSRLFVATFSVSPGAYARAPSSSVLDDLPAL